ncbi:MAG: glutamate--tRNA ligase, partial [Fimbriimonadaceae bacterium]|nr:glutamate--tRNA ligase [Alphaproteobacteria bacterium]
QGRVSWKNTDLDDFVILRSDGTPTYMLAVVVDDHDMDVTHIIRGDDHLTNAARQTLLFNAMNWTVPVMAHIPLIHGSDGAKLSKRHGALGVAAYRDMGYLPEALKNYLVRLGWSHGDDEIMSQEQMLEWFSLEGIGRGAARFDFAKLENLNGHYIRNASDERLLAAIEELLPHLPGKSGTPQELSTAEKNRILQAMPGLKERAKTVVELIESARYLTDKRPLAVEEKAAKILDNGGREVLDRISPHLQKIETWDAATIETAIREFAEQQDLKLGNIAQPLRSALTGRTVSPGIFDVLAVLGRDESLARIEDQVQ